MLPSILGVCGPTRGYLFPYTSLPKGASAAGPGGPPRLFSQPRSVTPHRITGQRLSPPPPSTRIPRCWRLYPHVPGHLPTQPPQPHFTPFFHRALHCSEGDKGGNLASSFFHRYVFLLVLFPSGRIRAAITLHLRRGCPMPRPRQREKPVPK